MLNYEKTDFNWWLKWLACIITLTGAVLNVLAADPWNVYSLNIGAAIYLWWSWRIREWSLITINSALLSIYLVGTLSRILN